MKTKIIVCGSGGQGIQFLAMLLAKSCIHKGMQVTMMKSYGPEARGGASAAYLTISDRPIVNPVITTADWLVAFNQIALDTWKYRANNIIFENNIDNMIMLGKLIKKLNIDINLVIETLQHEIGEKYKDRLEKNIQNIRVGYEQ